MTNSPEKLIAAVHQPNFMPWLGYIQKMMTSDIFIVMDNVQYVKGSWINRVQIKTQAGPVWITIPVKTKGNHFDQIKSIEICNDQKWADHILKTMDRNYRKCPHWPVHAPFLERTFTRRWEKLIDLNLDILEYIRSCFLITSKMVLMSSLKVEGSKSELIARACRSVGAGIYLSGEQAADYNDEDVYNQFSVKLTYQKFTHPVYKQLHGDFVPGLSAIDLLLNCGSDSGNYLQYTSLKNQKS